MAGFCRNKKEPQTAVGKALEMLSSKDPAQRGQAEVQLRDLGSGAIAELSEIMRVESEKRKKGQRTGFTLLAAYIGIVVLVVIGFFVHRAVTGHSSDFPTGLLNVFSYTGIFGGAMAVSQTQKSAGKALALLQDPKTVGFLAEALWFGDKEIQAQATTALIRLLPQMRASDAEDMTLEQRDALYKALKQKNQALVVAILIALRQIGDGHALAHVQRLVERPEIGGVHNEQVKQAATETLPYIQEFAARELAAGTLLRAASTPVDTEVLLRPAGTGAGTDPDLLLRPIGVDEGRQPINAMPLVADYAQQQEPEQLHARNGT